MKIAERLFEIHSKGVRTSFCNLCNMIFVAKAILRSYKIVTFEME